MKAFVFHYGPKLLSGARASQDLTRLASGGRLLLVTDRQIRTLGLVDPALAALEAAGRTVSVFDAVEPDPSRATLDKVVAAGRDVAATGVIGFGGGSVMDVAKLAAYLLGSGDDLDQIWGVDKATGQGLPLVLVPTTAGTGSEATGISIITLTEGEKRGVSSAALIADHAVLDPMLTVGLPRSVTAASGMDAMVHAIEAYTSQHLKNPVSDMLAREALSLLAGNLKAACNSPEDVSARGAMLLGAHLAGVAFANAPVAGVHALAYPLGGRFHVPHGLSNALMLPHVLNFNMPSAMSLYGELGPFVDPSLGALDQRGRADGLVKALCAMSAQIGLPQQLRDVGVGKRDVPVLAQDAMLQGRLLQNNPREITQNDAQKLYEAAL